MAQKSGNDYELESKIKEMSTYLDKLVVGEERDYRFDPGCASCSTVGPVNFTRRTPPLPYIPNMAPPIPSLHPQNYGVPMATIQYPLTSVTSALANRINTCNSTLRFVNPPPHFRARKWGSHKQIEKEPDVSCLDIEATMAELGLTPESLTNNEVYKLFSTFNKLAFYINAEYIFDNIYEGSTLPNTMSASAQTRHAVWSSNKLLRQLRDVLNKYVNVPSEYHGPLVECKQSLEDLQLAVLKLETFKYCVLEHRRGKFVAEEARENLEPLIESLNKVIECIGKSRMYIQVIEWTLNRAQDDISTVVGNTSKGPSQPLPAGGSSDTQHAKARPTVARRYIG